MKTFQAVLRAQGALDGIVYTIVAFHRYTSACGTIKNAIIRDVASEAVGILVAGLAVVGTVGANILEIAVIIIGHDTLYQTAVIFAEIIATFTPHTIALTHASQASLWTLGADGLVDFEVSTNGPASLNCVSLVVQFSEIGCTVARKARPATLTGIAVKQAG